MDSSNNGTLVNLILLGVSATSFSRVGNAMTLQSNSNFLHLIDKIFELFFITRHYSSFLSLGITLCLHSSNADRILFCSNSSQLQYCRYLAKKFFWQFTAEYKLHWSIRYLLYVTFPLLSQITLWSKVMIQLELVW